MNDKQPNPEELGSLLRTDRIAAEMSIDEVADATGIDRSTVNRLERGLITAPSPLNLQRLAEALRADVHDYFALAGYFAPHGLPDLAPYLRAKYHVSPEVASEVETYFQWARQREQTEHTNNNDQAAA